MNLPKAEQVSKLRDMPLIEVLRLAAATATRMRNEVDRIPELILEGLEARLEHDKPSREAADEVLVRLRGIK